jgi:hypothetical protein
MHGFPFIQQRLNMIFMSMMVLIVRVVMMIVIMF